MAPWITLAVMIACLWASSVKAEFGGYLGIGHLSGSLDQSSGDAGLCGTLNLRISETIASLPLSAVVHLKAQKFYHHNGPQESHLPMEAYLDYRGERSALRLGKQLVVYGVADGYTSPNAISPLNSRFQTYEDGGDRFGVPGARLTGYPREDTSLTAFYFPYHQSSILPGNPALGGLSPPDESLGERRNSYALRLDYRGVGRDAALMIYSGAANNPVLMPTSAGFAYGTTDVGVVAGELIQVTGPVTAFAEVASLNYDAATILGLRDELAVAVGFEYEANTDVRLIGQGTHREFGGESATPPHLALPAAINRGHWGQYGGSQTGASLSLLYGAPYEELGGDLSVASWFEGDDVYVRLRVKYRIDDRSAVYLRGDWFRGPGNTVFGDLEDTSRLFVEYRMNL